MIELEGSAAVGFSEGLRCHVGNNTVRGLAISRFPPDAILLLFEGGNVIEGNFIGTDITGTLDLGNSGGGLAVVKKAEMLRRRSSPSAAPCHAFNPPVSSLLTIVCCR